MDQAGLLKCIAEAGYNVGFGAKKHFATFDIVEKVPGWIGFVSFAVGVFGLVYEPLSKKVPSAILTIVGAAAWQMSSYRGAEYNDAGKELTGIFNDLRDLYRFVQGGGNLTTAHAQLRTLEERFRAASITKQIAVSGWYAHYKFFAEQQIGWVDEQLHFRWRDKVPLSAILVVGLLAISVVAALAVWQL